MNPITYSLNHDRNASEKYYPDIADFTDEVLLRARETIEPYARELHLYIGTCQLEPARTIEEYVFELINFGGRTPERLWQFGLLHTAPWQHWRN